MEGSHGRKVIGAVLLVALAVGFELELVWLFLAGTVLFMAWLGFVLLGPEP